MKTSQKQAAFYKLYLEWRVDPLSYIPVWKFIGEIEIEELSRWVLMSYKCPTRLSDIYHKNPGLLDRQYVHGKSGSYYYQYRIAKVNHLDFIRDERLKSFYLKIKGGDSAQTRCPQRVAYTGSPARRSTELGKKEVPATGGRVSQLAANPRQHRIEGTVPTLNI